MNACSFRHDGSYLKTTRGARTRRKSGFVRPADAHTRGWLTRDRFLFFASPKKRNQKKGDPDGATSPSRTRLCLPVVRRCIPAPAVDARGPSPHPVGLAGKGLRRSGAPYGTRTASFVKPWRFSSPLGDAELPTETTPGPKGCVMDHARAHPVQGCSAQCPRRTLLRQWAHGRRNERSPLGAMPPSPKELRHGSRRPGCAPSKATAVARAAAQRPSSRGESGFGGFCQDKSHPGGQEAERPANSLSIAPAGRTRPV